MNLTNINPFYAARIQQAVRQANSRTALSMPSFPASR